MTMTYHRLLSHNSYNLNKPIQYLFSILGTIGLIGSAIGWVSIHRKHHKYSDQPQDPHSPIYKGWIYSHFFSMFEKVEIKYAKDLIKKPFYRFQHRYYYLINFLYAGFLVLLFQDIFAIVYAWLFPGAILWNAVSSLVSVSHRNKKINTDIILSFLVFGEGYHKEHHVNPKSPRFGKFDLGGILINIFSMRGSRI